MAPMPEAVDPLFLSLQTALAGRYSIDRELGRGGMGVVYLAREVRLDRLVALKVLPPNLAVVPELSERFLREARTAAKLSHPNIIPIHAVDEVGDFVFFTMAYVQGDTLAQEVRARGPLPPAEAVRILREVAWALAYAHAQGVVHRDVKPDNILLESGTGRTLVADFGIARILHATSLTGAGEIVGTAEFMSPEQASGSEVDARSDLYSLGVVGYFLLSGKLPFEGPTVQSVLAQHLTTPARELASVAPGTPRKLARVIDQCLAKEPSARFGSGELLAETLERALGERTELPVPIRLWLASGDRLRLAYGLVVAAWWSLMLAIFVAAIFFPEGMPMPMTLTLEQWLKLLLVGIVPALALVPVLSVFRVFPTRRLLAAGYGLEDVRLALRLRLTERTEELSYQRRDPPVWARLVRWLGLGALSLAFGAVAVLLTSPTLGESAAFAAVFQWSLLIALGGGLFGVAFPGRRLSSKHWAAEWRLRFWNGRAGGWFVRLAGLGLEGRATGAQFTHRPTEIAIRFAADEVFQALPKEIRHELRDLPEVVRRLESHAQTIRKRVDELTEMVADADAAESRARSPALQRAEPGLAERRQAVMDDLRTTRDAAHQRLSTAVAALETIRLDLIRLRGGIGSVATITADLAAARELGEQIDRMLLGQGQIEEMLGPANAGHGDRRS
jgi:serine/threonine-protein kinase